MSDQVLENFWEKISVDNKTGCWNWIGYTANAGYGQFGVNYKIVSTHRFAYEVNKGKIPSGLVLDHLCRNRACCNPEHLETVTLLENIRRGQVGFINNHNTLKVNCKRGHPLSGNNLYLRKDGYRQCKTCTKLIVKNWSKYKRRKTHEA